MDPTALIIQALEFIALIVPKLASAATAAEIGNIIALIEQAIPFAVQVGEALIVPITNIIAALRGNGEITPEMLDQLDALEAKLDADFDAAADAAAAEDAKP